MNPSVCSVVLRLVEGLKSRNEDERIRALHELHRAVDRELKEVSIQNYVLCLDMLCSEILGIYTTGDSHEKKGAVAAMCCLTEVDFMNVHHHCRRFASHLLSRLPSTDLQLLALEAHLIGQFSLVFPCDFIEDQIKRACDSLLADSSDPQKQFSLLLLRELVLNAPTSFYQQFGLFVTAILTAFRDKNMTTRELATLTLRSALALAATREQRPRLGMVVTNDHSTSVLGHLPLRHTDQDTSVALSSTVDLTSEQLLSSVAWYRALLTEALRHFGEAPPTNPSEPQSQPSNHAKKLSRDDWVHGSILLLTELLISVLPSHEELLAKLDEMAGLPLLEFLAVQQSEVSHALRSATSLRWSTYDEPACLPADGLLPDAPILAVKDWAVFGRPHLKTVPPSAISSLCHRVLAENIDELWKTVLSWLKLKNQHLIAPFFKLLPRLIALKPSYLDGREKQRPLLDWLCQYTSRDREKPLTILCIALIGYHLGPDLSTSEWLSQLFTLIRSSLPSPREPPSKKRSAPLETAAILAVGVAIMSLGSAIYEPVKQILGSLIASGLNQPLVSTFKVITDQIPQLRKEIKDQLLSDINIVLMHSSNTELGQSHSSVLNSGLPIPLANISGLLSLLGGQGAVCAVAPTGAGAAVSPPTATISSYSTASGQTGGPVTTVCTSSMPPVVSSGSGSASSASGISRLVLQAAGRFHALRTGSCVTSCTNPAPSDFHITFPGGGAHTSGELSTGAAVVALALKTLGSFDFEGRPLAHFVKHISNNFISATTCDVKEIRLEAVKTCARLMLPWLKCIDSHQWYARPAMNTVTDHLGKLLTVGISDPDPDVRRCVFESIDPAFDIHLSQEDHLSSLFFALQDEQFVIQCLVMRRLGRLSDMNPACVQPGLRKVLLRTLDNLAHSGSTKNKVQSALLIACMISSAPRFFAPYAEPVLQILVPRIRQALPAALREYFSGTSASRHKLPSSLFDTGKTDYIVPTIFGDLLDTPDTTTMSSNAAAVSNQNEPPTKDRCSALNLLSLGNLDSPGYPRPLGNLLPVPSGQLYAVGNGSHSTNTGLLVSDLSAQWMEPTSVVIALFTTLGRLSAVAPAAVRRHLHEFIPVLCSMLQDPSCFSRRSVAIWTLSTLVSNTGWVVSPYQRHPYLLPLLLNMLKNEESKEIRQEILRALGVLGALDPFKFKLYTGQVDTFSDTGIAVSLHEADEKKDVDITQSELVVSLSWENQEVFSSVCALSALIHLLRDSTLQSQYASIVKTIVYVLEQLGPRAVYYQRQLMPDYFKCLQSTRDIRLQEFLIRQLGSIMLIVRLHTKEFASDVVDALLAHWWVAPNVQNACIRLLSPMCSVLGAEFRTHLTRLIPVILRTFQHEPNETNIITLLDILPQFGYCLEDHAHILVPAIASLIDITSETGLSVLIRSAIDVTHRDASATSDFPTPNFEDDFTDSSFDLAAGDASASQHPFSLADDNSAHPFRAISSSVQTPNVTVPVMSSLLTTNATRQIFVGSIHAKRACLDCLARLTDRVDLEDMCSQIVHPICRLLLTLESCLRQFQHLAQHHHHHHSVKASVTLGVQSCTNAIQYLHPSAMNVLTGLVLHTGRKFKPFLPLVQKMLNTLHIESTRFYTVLGLVEKGTYLSTVDEQTLTTTTSSAAVSCDQSAVTKEPDPSTTIKVFETRGINLERAWRSSRLMNRDDWDQWLKTLTAALLRESPYPSIRACSRLISITPAIGRTLFNAAFVSCWPKLTAPQQDCLISKLEEVLLVPDQSPEVSQAILNLEEFMAHVAKYSSTSARVPLLLSLHLLADRAMKNRAYAKALYYKEQEFLEEVEKRSSPSQNTLSCLLTIYSKLQLAEAATGVLLYATRNPHDKLAHEEIWREKLQDWKCALNLYENKLKDDRIRDKTPLILGRMRCLRSLGQWAPLNSMVTRYWDKVDESVRAQMAPLACTAAWAVNEWTQMERYASVLPTDQSFDGAFYRAVLNIHSGECNAALQCIQKARNVLDAELTTMAGESYDRAYADLIGTQLLSEAEEVIQYKLIPERRPILREAWRSRIRGCQSVVEDWSQIIQLRSLVLQPRDDLKTWLRFAGLCRRSGRFTFARQLLQSLLGQDPALSPQNVPIPNSDPFTVFAYTKLLWATGANEEAVTRLCVLVTHVLEPLLNSEPPPVVVIPRPSSAAVVDASEVLDNLDPRSTAAQAASERQELRTLMAKCCLRLGSWYSDLYARCPPNTFASDSIHTPTSTSAFSTASVHDSGLQHSVATANRLSRNRDSSFRSVPGYDTGQTHITRSNGPVRPATADGDHFRKAYSSYSCHSGLLADGTVVNVPQAWDERQGFVIQCYDAATKHAPENRLTWQSWAMTNYDVFKHLDALKAHIERAELELTKASSQSSVPHSSAPPSTCSTGSISPSAQTIADLWNAKTNLQLCMELHAAPSVRGFINSISLSPSANLQDSLRLINLLFKFGHLAEIRDIIREGLTKIRLSNWLLVIQQLLARIDTPRDYVAGIIIDLLISVGRSYPQQLVYPLVLAFKSGGSDRRRYNANRILYSMEEHSPRLVSEAFLLNEELIRLSITWVEMWSESLEDASRVYFGEKDIMKMFRILHPLHQMIDRGHETIHEAAFLQEHGNELNNCRICCETYERTSNKLILQQAWEGYYTLYRRFTKQVNIMNTLELCVSSPRLHEYGKDWELAVPGSYEPHRPLVRIAGIKNCLSLMTSKQHPRKLTVVGSDGHQYVFLLKGHEDTRQDERVMQFFGLVNTLLMNNSETLSRNLTIQRMSVVPLSTNTGLIGWVPNSDTLHSLIRDYREKTQTMLNKENREMISLAPDFDRLNVIQKTEVFEAGLRECSGRDLANILWLKSHSSEAWFERRTNFVRSMATMSMVGYILGLGDRHPSNIMLSRETGKVVHIDFGDCFEVAMMREKFPEKVPFRLTRMIIAAMEVTGIDGVYRQTCHMVMSLMRASRDSLLAVLEAFIHDPLLQWVLLESRKDFNQLDPKSDEGVDLTAQLQGNAAIAVLANGGMALPAGVQHARINHKQGDQHYHRQNLGAQTTTAYRPTDRTGGLAPPNSSQLQPTALDYQHHRQPYQFLLSKRVFTNPNHPDSVSLRDPYKVNPWRHHLCNGPWFGCYKTAKCLRKQTETGGIIVERQGLQGFIFSAKPPVNEDPSTVETESQPTTLGNNRARVVMARIRQKLTGMERDQPMDVPSQVDYLVREATSNQNLCQMYIGWCAFW